MKYFTRTLPMPDGWSQTNFYKKLGDGTLDYVIHHQPPGGAADIWETGNVHMLEFIPGIDAEAAGERFYNAQKACADYCDRCKT